MPLQCFVLLGLRVCELLMSGSPSWLSVVDWAHDKAVSACHLSLCTQIRWGAVAFCHICSASRGHAWVEVRMNDATR